MGILGANHKSKKKKSSFGSVVFSYSVQQWTISQLDCDMWWKVDFMPQPVMTSSVDKVIRSSNVRPKAILAPTKWSLKFSESEWNNYIWEVYSTNGWDEPKTASPAAGVGQQNGPKSPWQHPAARCTTNASKDEWIVPQSFASFTMFTRPLANRLLLLQVSQKLFAGKTLPQPARGRKCFPRFHLILKHKFLCYRNKQTFLFGKKCVECNCSYSD